MPAIALLAWLASLAPAGTVAAAEPLTWNACVREARANHPGLVRARLRLQAARARRHAAFGGFLPQASASVGANDSASENRLYFREADPRFNLRLGVSQSIFTGFSTLADYRKAAATVRKEIARFAQEEADVRHQLRVQFVNVLFGQENVRVQEDIAERRRSNADLVQLRYEAGREHKGTAMRSRADAREAAFDLARARRALILARQRLAVAMGRDDFAEVEVIHDWSIDPPPADADLSALSELTPSVIQAIADVDTAEANLTSAASSFWPTLSASASVSRSGRGPVADMTRGWSAGATLSYPLFRGGRRWFDYRAAGFGVGQAGESLTAARRNARVALQAALFAFQDSYEALEVRQAFLDATRQRAEIGRARYANGLLGFVQWDIIEAELVLAERRSIQARRDALNSAAAWARVKGDGFEE